MERAFGIVVLQDRGGVLPESEHNNPTPKPRTRLIDILLLRIISAHKSSKPSDTDEKRLKQAKKALFGEHPNLGRTELDDDYALLLMAKRLLEAEWPSLIHELQIAASNLKDEAFEGTGPEKPEKESPRATISAILEDPLLNPKTKHSDEAAYRRLLRKVNNGGLSVGNLLEIEQIEDGTHPDLEVIEQILQLLEKLGVDVGHN